MAFAPLDAHFRFPQPDPSSIDYLRPGFAAKIGKTLNVAPPVVIFQDGYCLPTQVGDLLADRGNTQVLVNVNAILLGVFPNCYKYRAHPLEGVKAANAGGSGTHGMVRYEIEWHQLTP